MTIGVVGAGITGLALTHACVTRGLDVVAYEARDRPGGVIRSERVAGKLLEYGPQRIRHTSAVATLLTDLDLEEAVLAADADAPLYVYVDGSLRLVPRSVSALLRTDLLSWRGKLRLLREPLQSDPPTDGSARAYFEAKFGTEAYERLIGPLFGGIYASDPARMPAAYSLERVIALERSHGSLLRVAINRLAGKQVTPPPISLESGLETLPQRLYDQYRDHIQLNSPVEGITDGPGDHFALVVDGDTVTVDHVVITTPAPVAGSLLGEIIPVSLESLTYNPLVIVHLVTDAPLSGFGYQTATTESLRTRGVTWNGGLFDRDGVATAFLGGMDDPEIMDESTAAIGRQAATEFETVTGYEARVLDVTRLPACMPAYDQTWAILEDLTLPDGISLATNYTGRPGVPSRIRSAARIADTLANT